MKLDVAVNEVVLANAGPTGEFRIRNSAKAFKILSDGLYSNKIRAIIRELSCNALDSHVGAGKADVPFEVHLPSVMEPWFSVRDFGMGLDGNQVVNIYTTYFESTKTDSNEFIGALGLGSKSPFSYTENFTVTAIKGGIRRIYSAYINDMGIPSIAEMSSELTDEGNGVEVKFSVIDRYDYNSFIHEAKHVFRVFKNKPNVIGIDHYEHSTPKYQEENIVPGVHISGSSESFAIMGNISYPLGKIPEPEKHFKNLASLLECGLTIEFDIGELDFAASREELSYVPLTINSIRKKLELLNANLATIVATKADAIACEWERAAHLEKQYHMRLYKSAVIKYVTDSKFELFDVTSYNGRKYFKFPLADLAQRGLSVVAFRARGHGTSKIAEDSEWKNGTYVKQVSIPVEKEVIIVLNDLKTGCGARAKYHYGQVESKYASVYCFSHDNEDLVERQKVYDELLKELHNPPTVVKASELEKQVRARSSVTTNGIMRLYRKSQTRYGQDAYGWEPVTGNFDATETYYYVCLSHVVPQDETGNFFDVQTLKHQMEECGLKDLVSTNIYGVRKTKLKEVKAADNWVWIEDYIKEETAKVSDTDIAKLVVAELLDSYYDKVYTNGTVAKLVGPDSDYAKFYKKYGGLKRAQGSVTQLIQLCSKYGKSMQVDKVKDDINAVKTALYEKYRLLKHLTNASGVSESDVADYIKMVDKQENT